MGRTELDGVEHYDKAKELVDVDPTSALTHGVLALVALLADRPWQYADGNPLKMRWKKAAAGG